MQGFICQDADVTGITTAYNSGQGIKLHEDLANDAKSRALPQSCYLSHLEIQTDVTGAGATQFSLFLTWDSAGDDPITSEATAQAAHAAISEADYMNLSVAIDVWVTAPTGQTTSGAVYLWMKTNAGTLTLKKARLHWVDRPRG